MLFIMIFLACNRVEIAEDTGINTSTSNYDTSDYTTEDTEDTKDTGETDPVWDTAYLKVISPESGDFIPLGQEATFEAIIYSEDNKALEYDNIDWKSSEDSDWALNGTKLLDSSLIAGNHTITASATLPNNDRLSYSIGNVLVQSPYAGTYVGDLYVSVTMDYNGQSYTMSCAGGATVVVSMEGTEITGDSSCLMSLMGYYDLDMSFILNADNNKGQVDGTIAADLSFFQYDLETSGTLTEEGEYSSSFAGDFSGITIEGQLEASRISRDTSLQAK